MSQCSCFQRCSFYERFYTKMKMEVGERRLLSVLMHLYPDTFFRAFVEFSVCCMVVLWGY